MAIKRLILLTTSVVSLICVAFYCKAQEFIDDSKQATKTFEAIIDLAGVTGAILVYDVKSDTYFANDFTWAAKGQLPASTFKIPNSIIALESGIIEDENTLFKWNGEPRNFRAWEKDLTFKEAFQVSCVPCYQEVARKIGVEKMNEDLSQLNFGTMDVSIGNIDMFWLQGESKINQFQQIDFLKRLYFSKLPISERTTSIMKKIMLVDETDTYRISGKTGWSVDGEVNNGWFVGYLENANKLMFFATNLSPKDGFDMSKFSMIRKELTYKALAELGAIDY